MTGEARRQQSEGVGKSWQMTQTKGDVTLTSVIMYEICVHSSRTKLIIHVLMIS